jgi:septum site-determining protein MinD
MPKHLLITRYDLARAARGEMLSIEDVLDILSIPLLGIVPESEEVLRASNVGSPVTVCNAASAPARAYADACRRLRGEVVPVTIPSDRKSLLGKLFGRRAA